MRAFEFVTARNARHAVELLAAHGPAAKLVAGGTDLIADLKSASTGPEIIVDISRLAELKGIAIIEEGLRIGALATFTDIMRSPHVRDACPALADAAHSIGAVQTRNLGTIGGNLMTCVPSMDSGPVLLALDAELTACGVDGSRRMPLSELFVGPRRTSLRFDQLLVEIVIPGRNLGKGTAFRKFGLRKGQALALVNVAASCWLDGDCFREPAIALGAVAPTVMRARNAEAYLAGRAVSLEAMAEAGRIAAGEASPISDFRAGADYRRELIAVLTTRALQSVHAQAGRAALAAASGRAGG